MRTSFDTRSRGITGLAVSAAALLFSHEATAQRALERLSLRVEIGAGPMLPSLQRERLGFDSVHIQTTARIGVDLVDWLSLQASVNNGLFLASGQQSNGNALALQLGLRAHPRVGSIGRAWGDLNPGYYLTGADRRLGLDGGVGFEFNLGRAAALGPFARFHWIPADTSIHEASDATYLTFGASITLRVPPAEVVVRAETDRDADGLPDASDACPSTPAGARPDPARRGCPLGADSDADGVLDSDDLCVSVPAGAHADPARRGCPVADQDGDGVLDPSDLCVNVPAGALPDPARLGCPTADQDADGVADPQDQCPAVHRGARPDPARLGCPVGDRDQDGIIDSADRCPDQAETFNGRSDDDGCPDGRALGTRGAGRIRISEQIKFRTDSAEIRGRRSFMILDAIAAIMRVSPDIAMLHVEGHTDDQGEVAHNRELSNQRAASVIRELTTRGIAATRLTPHGFGSDRPLVQGSSRRARAANRRIEFRVDLEGATTEATPAPPSR